MTLFLLEFDRDQRQLVEEPRKFLDSDRGAASAARDVAQRRVTREKQNRDVVLLEASSIEVLKQTHGSFFLTPSELVERIAQ